MSELEFCVPVGAWIPTFQGEPVGQVNRDFTPSATSFKNFVKSSALGFAQSRQSSLISDKSGPPVIDWGSGPAWLALTVM